MRSRLYYTFATPITLDKELPIWTNMYDPSIPYPDFDQQKGGVSGIPVTMGGIGEAMWMVSGPSPCPCEATPKRIGSITLEATKSPANLDGTSMTPTAGPSEETLEFYRQAALTLPYMKQYYPGMAYSMLDAFAVMRFTNPAKAPMGAVLVHGKAWC